MHTKVCGHEEMPVIGLTVLTRRGDEMFLWKIAFMVAESSGNSFFFKKRKFLVQLEI